MEPTITVLVADDEATVRRTLERILAGEGYAVLQAGDGREALDVIGRGGVDLALLDVDMPVMDGLEAIRRLRARHRDDYVAAILVTGNAAAEDVERGLAAGADDYVKKPVDATELRARVRNVLRIRRMERELHESHRELRGHLEAARELLRRFVPDGPRCVPGARFAWMSEPSHYVGGDVLGVVDLGDGRHAFHVADIAGHGAPAAMLAIWLNRELEGPAALRDGVPGDPAAVCARIEETFAASRPARAVALVYGVLDHGGVRLSVCGMPRPVLVRRGQRAAPVDAGGGPPLGLGIAGEPGSLSLELGVGDRLYLCSDGLLEALEPEGAAAESSLCAELDARAELDLEAQLSALRDLVRARRAAADAADADDVTLLGLEVVADVA